MNWEKISYGLFGLLVAALLYGYNAEQKMIDYRLTVLEDKKHK